MTPGPRSILHKTPRTRSFPSTSYACVCAWEHEKLVQRCMERGGLDQLNPTPQPMHITPKAYVYVHVFAYRAVRVSTHCVYVKMSRQSLYVSKTNDRMHSPHLRVVRVVLTRQGCVTWSDTSSCSLSSSSCSSWLNPPTPESGRPSGSTAGGGSASPGARPCTAWARACRCGVKIDVLIQVSYMGLFQ